jgi:hypothetical protein
VKTENTIRWQLELGGDIIAEIIDQDQHDFPWDYGRLVDDTKFKRFANYFHYLEEENWNDCADDIKAISEEVSSLGGFILRDLKTGKTHEPILYDFGNLFVWFR